MDSPAGTELPEGHAFADLPVPPRTAADAELHTQCLRLVSLFSANLAVFGAVGCAIYLGYFFRSPHRALLVVALHIGLLSLAGLVSFIFCWQRRLRVGSYVAALALVSQGTVDLVFMQGSLALAVVNYCVAIGLTALGLEGRDWGRIAISLGAGFVVGSVLQNVPVVEQVQVPDLIATRVNFAATGLSLAYITALFWLFRSKLAASQTEAWEFARTAARANWQKTQFLSTMSHELRSPLHVVIGNAQMLQEGAAGESTPDQRHLAGRIEKYGRELLRLVEGALQVSRLESGRTLIHVEPFDVREVVDEVFEAVAAAPQPHGLAIRIHAVDTPEMVTDRMKLKEIIQNLVTNAIKFTEHGHVALRVGPAGADVQIDVEDTGIGIAADDLPTIFESFGQLRPDDAMRGGVGLGLYIVKRLVDLLGGTISVESTVGAGTIFRVRIPVRHPVGAPSPSASAARAESPSAAA